MRRAGGGGGGGGGGGVGGRGEMVSKRRFRKKTHGLDPSGEVFDIRKKKRGSIRHLRRKFRQGRNCAGAGRSDDIEKTTTRGQLDTLSSKFRSRKKDSP